MASIFTQDEITALAEQTARSYGLQHGMRYTQACDAVVATQDALQARGDVLGVYDFRLSHCDLLPPEQEDPALHRAVAKLKLEREYLSFALRGWPALDAAETARADELIAWRKTQLQP